jgi:hypothetical protein
LCFSYSSFMLLVVSACVYYSPLTEATWPTACFITVRPSMGPLPLNNAEYLLFHLI